MQYRPFSDADFDQLYAIEEACFQPPLRFSPRYMRQLLSSATAACWIAEEGGQLAGFAIVEWAEESGAVVAYIPTIEVAAEHRGKGVGGELLRRIEGSSQAAGARSIRLHVSEENAAAIRLYEAHGYRREGREENFYARGHAGLVYQKELGQKELGNQMGKLRVGK